VQDCSVALQCKTCGTIASSLFASSPLLLRSSPLYCSFGLRFGIVNQLQNDLANDPRNLEIRMLSSGSYDQHWITQLRQRPDVGFAIGQTRSLNTLTDLQTDSTHFIENAEVIPTEAGDPLLGTQVLHHDHEVVITQEAARKLAVKTGDTLTLRVSRMLDERREWGRKRVTVVGILPATYFNRPAIFTRPALLMALEHFRDGYAVTALGSPAALSLTVTRRATPAQGCTHAILTMSPALNAICAPNASKPPVGWRILRM
jgi:putative ABC transport system permease protein